MTSMQVLQEIWTEARSLEMEDLWTLMLKPTAMLFDALESNNDDHVIRLLLHRAEIMIVLKDTSGQNLLHLLILHQRYDIVEEFKMNNLSKYSPEDVDVEGHNVLHLDPLWPSQFRSVLD
ncbi:hypothetical protein DEO72_LG7g1841 [Vigna unguiculata]|uniref:Uncharacterized protein n=1 Tax=Vigna unguiculata TaxID=3917 RepID=A0A4D6MIK1_VIGUN|nr:hypothetical protein DEO72_LG7g1841 [Vigna unguiculata]